MAKKNSQNRRMMLDIIESVIKDKYKPEDQSHMIEIDTNGKIGSMVCHIDCYDEEVLLCSFDEHDNNYLHFPYFKQEHGMVSMCDYILFVEDTKNLFVFLCELKDSTDGPKKQTLRSKPFAEFIIKRIKAVKGDSVLPKDVHYRHVGIKTTCNKMTTKGYDKMEYDKDGYLVLPDYHKFYTRRLMDL